METDKFTNTHLLPSTVIDSYWLYEADKLKDSNNNIGKWMLFYPKNEMNNNWKLAKKLYNENALNGVVSMKCSTNKKNKNATNDNGIIIFYPTAHFGLFPLFFGSWCRGRAALQHYTMRFEEARNKMIMYPDVALTVI